MNRAFLQKKRENLELEGVIESYELAFRMQGALPEVMDIGRETEKTLELYGVGKAAPGKNGRAGKATGGAAANTARISTGWCA